MIIKFPSINQFRNVVYNVNRRAQFVGFDSDRQPIYDKTLDSPILKYQGTVKIHGTNASISLNLTTNELTYQSRERVLTLEQDNSKFMLSQMSQAQEWTEFLSNISKLSTDVCKNVTVYGEWCGTGIQKGVGGLYVSKDVRCFCC